MSWSNYLYNEELNVAIEIGKKSYNNIDDEYIPDLEEVNDILCHERYTPEEKCGAVRAIFDKSIIWDNLDFVISYLINNYEGWEILPEDDEKLYNAKRLNLSY